MRSAVLPWQSVSLVLTLALVAEMPAAQVNQTGEKQPAPCVVSGQVVTAADGAPIRLARVALVQENIRPHPAVFAATTDNEGRFEIKKVAPGRYRFFASRPGFLHQEYQAKGTRDGAMLTLSPGQEFVDVLFRLARAAVITGRVVDESGEPMDGVMVTALRKVTAEEKEDWGPRTTKVQMTAVSSAVTDDRGEYRIFGLKPGEYYLKAGTDMENSGIVQEFDYLEWRVRRDLGSRYAPVFYPGVVQFDQAQPVTLAAGEEVQAEFAMRHVKTVNVAGRVIMKDGKPATQAYVDLSFSEILTMGGELSASTNAKGEFNIKGVPPGSYVLRAQQGDESNFRLSEQKLEVGEENIDSLVLAFGKGMTIPGRITAASAGLNGFDEIQLVLEPAREGDSGLAFGKAKPDGSFQVADVVDGNYVLRVNGMEQGWYVASARWGGENVLQKGLRVERGSSGGTLEIVVSSASAQLEGTVTEQDKPAVGAKVRAKPDPETIYNLAGQASTSTDQNGHFTFSTLPPGKYKVSAKLPAASTETPAATSEPKMVTLGEHDHQAVQLTLVAPPSE